ncbi:hypothetical protein GGS21DRAFT_490523 [Xylaria nigripes]|nr:hypothetical protein GGS21DRAFT_490523 [Xylaria nigripes]
MEEKRSLRYRPSMAVKALSGIMKSCATQIRFTWLFTADDLKTIIAPCFIFGAAHYFAIESFSIHVDYQPSLTLLLQASPYMLLWIWTNLAVLCIANQKEESAIAEDKINKPWRPLPSREISVGHAKNLMLLNVISAHLMSYLMGCGLRQSFGLLLLNIWYNHFGGSDHHPLIRNLLNGLGYLCFMTGALEVAVGTPLPLFTPGRFLVWLGILGAIITTTIHLQDLYDQEGDSIKGRQTMPLVIGDVPARLLAMSWMLFWAFLCPFYWTTSFAIRALFLSPGLLVAFRTMYYRTVAADKTTFKHWLLWLSCVFCLPLLRGTAKWVLID